MRLFESFKGLLLIVLLFVTLNRQNKTLASKDFNFTLRFYFRQNEIFSINDPDKFNQIKDIYKPKYKTVFIVHGYDNNWGKDIWMDDMKDMIYKKHNRQVNVFIVDWAYLASFDYGDSAAYTKVVGRQLATFIAFIKEKLSADMDRVHLVGHSLGAQVSGFTGKALQKNHNITIGKITGLDPAGPGFTNQDPKERLDRNDAKLVEVLHTNIGDSKLSGYGNVLKLGDADIYLNGGARQPPCYKLYLPNSNYDDYVGYYTNEPQTRRFQPPSENEKNRKRYEPVSRFSWSAMTHNSCPHARALDFYIEAKKCTRTFCERVAYACDRYWKFLEGECADCGERNEKCRLFEYNANTQLDMPLVIGYSYFMQTNPSEPFCANHYQLDIQFRESNVGNGKIKITLIGDRDSHEWDDVYGTFQSNGFKAVVHTPKNLGVLKSATGDLGWVSEYKTRTIVFIVMHVRYMSNMKPGIRKNLSAEMTPAGPLIESRYFRFDRIN